MALPKEIRLRPCTGMAMLIAMLVLGGCGSPAPHTYRNSQSIEYHYSSTGPYEVSQVAVPAVFGRPGGAVFLPDGFDGRAPLVIWQNGTGVGIGTYDAIARHLASWGMVVIGSNDTQMGSGQRAINMLEDARLWSATPNHPLFKRIAADRFAFVGSSQGAVGAINAHSRFDAGRQARALVIHGTPTKEAIRFFGLDLNYDAEKITAPVLILTGTEDEFISPIRLNQAIFDGLDGPGLRFLGVANGADHVELADDAGRMRGYLTAWLAFLLSNDPHAAQAFLGPMEITKNPDWSVTRVSQ